MMLAMVLSTNSEMNLRTKLLAKIDKSRSTRGSGIKVARLARSCAFAYLGDSLAYRRKRFHREETQLQPQSITSIMYRNRNIMN